MSDRDAGEFCVCLHWRTCHQDAGDVSGSHSSRPLDSGCQHCDCQRFTRPAAESEA